MGDKNHEEYNQLRDWIRMMDEGVKNLKLTYASSVTTSTNVPFTPQVFDAVLPYTLDYVKNEMQTEEIKNVLAPYEILDGGEGTSRLAVLNDEETKHAMTIIKSLSLVLLRLEKENDGIKMQASDLMNEYVNYLASSAILKNKEEKLKLFKDANELEVDEKIRRANDKNIEILENEISLAFLTERIDKLGYKEKDALLDRFFNNQKGIAVVNKFSRRIKRCGYRPDIYKYFINIEESFLPEEYHPFNNFFLSIYMNYVGNICIDIKREKIYTAAITSNIASLIYHTFADPEDEKKFIEFIKSVLDRFKDDPEKGAEYVDMFKLKNRSYSKHPDRIRLEKESNIIKRNTIFKRFEELNIENPFDDECDVNEAKKYLEEKVEKLRNSQLHDGEEIAEGDDEVLTEAGKDYANNLLDEAQSIKAKIDELSTEEESENNSKEAKDASDDNEVNDEETNE